MSPYTPEELKAIVEAPILVGLAVAMADTGVVSTAIEVTALSTAIAGAAKKYPNNAIIQAAFSKEALGNNQVKPAKPEITPEEARSGALVDRAIATANSTLTLLAHKASEADIRQYKRFIYECSAAVAEAAGSGLFGSGNKVSAKEAAALTKIKTGIGI
ncbi:MAG TPA: hypothetical protein V6D07_13335 [Trichocoleus sp.]